MISYLPKWKYKMAKKRITNEINKAFPNWIRTLILHLQTENVHMALEYSLEECPLVLHREIELLIDRIDEKPNSIEPYLLFLDGYDVHDLKSSIKHLYAMFEYGQDDL